MKRFRNVWSLIAVVTMLAIVTSGCAKEFDASGYAKACIDAMYQGKFTEYAKLLNISEEEANADREAMAEEVVDAEFTADPYITAEQKEEYQQLILSAYEKTKYEVGKAEKTEDGYEVSVEVEPALIIGTFENGLEKKYMEAVQANTMDETQIYPIAFAYFKECIDNVAYAESTTATVKVAKNKDGVWQISEAEMMKLESVMLPVK